MTNEKAVTCFDRGPGCRKGSYQHRFFSPNSLLGGFSMQLRCLRRFRTLSPFVSLHMVVAVSAFLGLCLPLSSLVYVGVLFFGSDFGFHTGKFLILKKIVNRNDFFLHEIQGLDEASKLKSRRPVGNSQLSGATGTSALP